MRVIAVVVCFALIGGLAVGCDGDPRPDLDAARLSVQVGALDLPGVATACYDLEVRNDLEQRVWMRGARPDTRAQGDVTTICSDDYGVGGDVAYVGPCDATDADGADEGTAINTVTLWVDGLYDDNGADVGGWTDPCPDGCTLRTSCGPNADTAVTFQLTIVRRAVQGFFDIAISFDDIFCSA